ncbi:carbonic anhydrase [Caballeronia jiangsuensis]|nr:carbonic anhydrase [Caballeronia jiangsuensis]
MQNVFDGFRKFHRDVYSKNKSLFYGLARQQKPKALFICCSDSRMIPEMITQCEPGELFVIRNAGNIVPSFGPESGGVTATVEYAVSVLQVEDIIVCGHSDCGAMKAIVEDIPMAGMPAVRNWLQYADAARAVCNSCKHATSTAHVDAMIRLNVIAQLNNIRTHPSVALATAQSRLRLHGWVFDIQSGRLDVLDLENGTFSPLLDENTV